MNTATTTEKREEYRGYRIKKEGDHWEVWLDFRESSIKHNARQSCSTLEQCHALIDEQCARLDKYSEEVCEIHSKVVAGEKLADEHSRQAIQSAVECGKKLVAAKELLSHGQWGLWLEQNCNGFCEKTATNYMRLANPQHDVADLTECSSLRQAYIAIGVIKETPDKAKTARPPRPEPSEFVKAKGLAVRLWNLLHGTTDADRMAVEIEGIVNWHRDYLEAKQKREAALNDGFEIKQAE